MSATREHRNASMLEDACAAIGTVITTFEHLHAALAHVLPDEFPAIDHELTRLIDAHAELQRRVVDGEQPPDEAGEIIAEWERISAHVAVPHEQEISNEYLAAGIKLTRRVLRYEGSNARVARIMEALRTAGFPVPHSR